MRTCSARELAAHSRKLAPSIRAEKVCRIAARASIRVLMRPPCDALFRILFAGACDRQARRQGLASFHERLDPSDNPLPALIRSLHYGRSLAKSAVVKAHTRSAGVRFEPPFDERFLRSGKTPEPGVREPSR